MLHLVFTPHITEAETKITLCNVANKSMIFYKTTVAYKTKSCMLQLGLGSHDRLQKNQLPTKQKVTCGKWGPPLIAKLRNKLARQARHINP